MEPKSIESRRVLTESDGKRLVLLLKQRVEAKRGGGHVWPLEALCKIAN